MLGCSFMTWWLCVHNLTIVLCTCSYLLLSLRISLSFRWESPLGSFSLHHVHHIHILLFSHQLHTFTTFQQKYIWESVIYLDNHFWFWYCMYLLVHVVHVVCMVHVSFLLSQRYLHACMLPYLNMCLQENFSSPCFLPIVFSRQMKWWDACGLKKLAF